MEKSGIQLSLVADVVFSREKANVCVYDEIFQSIKYFYLCIKLHYCLFYWLNLRITILTFQILCICPKKKPKLHLTVFVQLSFFLLLLPPFLLHIDLAFLSHDIFYSVNNRILLFPHYLLQSICRIASRLCKKWRQKFR